MNHGSDRYRKQRLFVSFLVIIFIFVFLGVFTIRGLKVLGDLTRSIYEHPLVVSNASLNAALETTKMHRDMKDIVLAIDPEEMEVTLLKIDATEKKVFEHLNIVRESILGEDGKILEKETRKLFQDWKPIREEVIHLLESGRRQEAVHITKAKGAEHVAKLEASMYGLNSYARNKSDNLIEFAEAKQSNFENVILILSLLGVVLSLIISVFAVRRVVIAENLLREKNQNLQNALDEIKVLRGILPICMHCKGIRNDEGYWNQLETYITENSDVRFSHGICDKCLKEHYHK
jgi:hypothetical protein